ncbi:DnaJ protein, putative [Plasmodium gallinaceum]|uniref:DnaJ protein, putative n=1 Tax=Plasmodium gallinaceum TaxID=5849 RepID=A0A1J1GST6_PLAGA|nr:DnaJ protein, putative [Plasmodium gallinaceum]CRG94115.1 DnaJ protein, putative [Plasmodium gallinaceum]
MKTKNSFINKWIFIIFSKIPSIFCSQKKKILYQEIIENVKTSKIINYPIDKNSVNFYFISNKISKLLNVADQIIDEKKKKIMKLENCLNLYYLLVTSAKLNPSILKKYILEYIEERISWILKKNKNVNIDHKLIPYTIHIRREKLLCNLINELNVYCSNYLKKINNIKTRYLVIDKNEINIDEEWKKKHEYIFNKNKLKIPISKHNYEFILYGLNESSLRKKVLHILNIPYKNKNLNSDVINILKKRYEIANKCGYNNWSHYSISHFTSEKNNYNNLNEFFNLIKTKIDKDNHKINFNMMKLFNLKKKNNCLNNNYVDNNINNKIDIYDWYYYYNKMSNKSDEYFINTFFPQNSVLNNFIQIISKIYNFSYERVTNKEILKKWPNNSIIYKIKRGNEKKIKQSLNYEKRDNMEFNDCDLLGYIYIIPYMNIRLKDYFKIPLMNSLSSTYLICNGHVLIDYKFMQTVPLEKKLFSSSEILTLFHEFGHAYHLLLLSNKYSLYNFYNIPLDYAEYFSHINEHLVNNYNIIYNLSNKEINNSKINENLFNSIKFDSSRLFNIYLQSLIDYKIHDMNPFLFFSNNNQQDEYALNDFYKIIQNYLPYKISSLYSIHSTSFPYHFSCYYAGSVLSYLLAEIRVILNNSTNDISLKKNNTLISFQKKFYNFLSKDFRDETYPSIIKSALSNQNLIFNK